MKPSVVILMVAMAVTSMIGTSHATIILNFEEVGDEVVGTLSGSFRDPMLAGAFESGPFSLDGLITPTINQVGSTFTDTSLRVYNVPFPLPVGGEFGDFGFGGTVAADISTGPALLLDGFNLQVLLGPEITSGNEVMGTLVFLNSTFASLGIAAPGSFAYDIGFEQFVVSFGSEAVPLPAAALLFCSVLLPLVACRVVPS